jgi:2-amino-4-hydroxy-6-hydroxymethyldihydropteridine diphosphokinase
LSKLKIFAPFAILNDNITMDKMSSRIVYLALGTNLGDRLGNLQAAVLALPPALIVLKRSSIYETPPWGLTDQPVFLNMVLSGKTQLTPLALLAYLKHLETQLGRLPSTRYGPRKIDIDILFYDDIILNTPELTIPHPNLHERAFVLVPMMDLAPEFVHPVLGKSIRTLLAVVDTTGVKRHE